MTKSKSDAIIPINRMHRFLASFPCLPRTVLAAALCGLLASCVELDKRDAFPVAGPPLDLPALQALAGADGELRPLKIAGGGPPVSAWYLRHRAARGVLIFCGGSGNQIDAALKTLGPRTGTLGLDLVVFSYYQRGEAIPSVTEVRAKIRVICVAVEAMHSPASRSIYVMGHSLGGWFALDVAADEPIRGLTLVGAETTPAEVIRKTDAPWASLVAIRPDADARQLDASLYAPRIHVPTLVVTSRQDEAVPSTVGQELFAMLPPATPKRIVVLDGVTHGRYFLSDEFWRQFADFFGLRVSRPTAP